jgi:hypothetical protein
MNAQSRRFGKTLLHAAAAAIAASLLLLAGCGGRRITDTPRTASEQLLISAAVDRAATQLDFSYLAGRKIFIDTSLINRVDKEFLISSLRFWAWQRGCIVVPAMGDSQYVVEVSSGSVGMDRNDYLLGIPAMPLPGNFGGSSLPEAAIYKSVRQTGICRLGFTVYRRESWEYVYSSGPMYGYADQKSSWLFGAGPSIVDNIRPARTGQNTTEIPPAPPPAKHLQPPQPPAHAPPPAAMD